MPKGPPIPRRENVPEGRELGLKGASLESVPPKSRGRFSAPEKLRILKAAEAAVASGKRGGVAALLRKEGIYSSHLTAWRSQLYARGPAGLVAQKPGRKPKLDANERQLLAVTKELARVKHKLLVARALIDLQKKRTRSCGSHSPSSTRRACDARRTPRQKRTDGRGLRRARGELRDALPLSQNRVSSDRCGRECVLRVRVVSIPASGRTSSIHFILPSSPTSRRRRSTPRCSGAASTSRRFARCTACSPPRGRQKSAETSEILRSTRSLRSPRLDRIRSGPGPSFYEKGTKLATMQKGVFLMAYVIIDLFSRYVVGWMLAKKECKHLAAQLFAESIARHGIEPGLQVHMDRGPAMKSDTLAQLLASLGASRSFSRPRVSDDNAFSEAQFKTMKYQPDYPGRFDGELHGRGWLQDFFGWHNDDHHHSSLALFTPAEVFFGRVAVVAAARQRALDLAYGAHPERFPNGAPRVPLPPAAVHINPLTDHAIQVRSLAASHDDSATSVFVTRPPAQRLPPLRRSEVVASIAT